MISLPHFSELQFLKSLLLGDECWGEKESWAGAEAVGRILDESGQDCFQSCTFRGRLPPDLIQFQFKPSSHLMSPLFPTYAPEDLKIKMG